MSTAFYFGAISILLGYSARGWVVTDKSEFSEVIKSSAYVDKTPLLKHILDNFLLVTAPQGFLKTTNLNMIKRFLSVNVNKTGELQESTTLESYNLFKDFNIFKMDRRFFDMHFGQYPVLHLDLKSDFPIGQYEDALTIFHVKIHKRFKEHEYLTESKHLDDHEREICKTWCSVRKYRKLQETVISTGLKDLAKYLFKHFNRRIYVLVDDYDAILSDAMFTVKDEEVFDDIVRLVTDQMSVLVQLNPHVRGAFITGASYIAGTGFSNTNNLKVCRFLEDHPLQRFYSFSEAEVNTLFDIFNLEDEKKKEAKLLYDGYYCMLSGHIYNPFSLLIFLDGNKVNSNWKLYGHVQRFKNVLKYPPIMNKTELLLQKQILNISHPKYIKPNDLILLRNLFHQAKDFSRAGDIFLSHLLELGYLSYASDEMESITVGLKIPNREIGEYFVDEWKDYLVEMFKVERNDLSEVNYCNFEFGLEKLRDVSKIR